MLERAGRQAVDELGNVLSARGWEEVLLPVIDRHQDREQSVVIRADAAFALPEIDNKLELGRLIDGEIARLRPVQNLVHTIGRVPAPENSVDVK